MIKVIINGSKGRMGQALTTTTIYCLQKVNKMKW